MAGTTPSAPANWLDTLEVASPCHESWDAMRGDERARHCGSCDQIVYDLSGMTRSEAEALVSGASSGERVCVRFRRRADGTVLTADCPTRLERGRRFGWLAQLAGAVLAALGVGLSSGCKDDPEPVMMGEMVAPPPTGQGYDPYQQGCDTAPIETRVSSGRRLPLATPAEQG